MSELQFENNKISEDPSMIILRSIYAKKFFLSNQLQNTCLFLISEEESHLFFDNQTASKFLDPQYSKYLLPWIPG